MHPRDLAVQTFQQHFHHQPAHIVMAPARVNILGEHVDYNDGFVLPAAIDRATYVAFSPAGQAADRSILVAADFDEQAAFTPDSILAKADADGIALSEWARYPAGVAWALSQAGLPVPAMHAAFASNVPIAAGLSSSASVEVAFGLAWSMLGGWSVPSMDLALLCQKAENQYVGMNCGIMDQFASACGVADRLLLLDCRSLEWETLPVPGDTAIVIADTAVRRSLTDSAYNQRRWACEEAVSILSAELPGVESLRDVSVDDFNRLCGMLPQEIEKRARHVVEEIERTQRAIPLLNSGEIAAFGRILYQCHASLRDLYEVSIRELDLMVEIARDLPGCLGARLTGAGFGGCTVNLVDKNAAPAFAARLAEGYRADTGLEPETYICRASSGAQLLAW